MKKIIIVIAIVIGIYLLSAVVLKVSGVCPENINLMPRVVGSDSPNQNWPKSGPVWRLMCPFAGKVY